MVRVEILLATRNGAAFLERQLISIAAQRGVNWALKISDDRSHDKTWDIATRFAERYDGVSLQRSPNTGLAPNFLGMLNRVGNIDFVAFSDHDDIWLPGKLHRAVQKLREIPKQTPAVYASSSYILSDTGAFRPPKSRSPRLSFGNALVQNALPGHSIMLNKAAVDLLQAVQPKVSPPFHDWWIYAILSGTNGKIIYDPRPGLLYRQHQNAALGDRHGLQALRRRLGLLVRGECRDYLRRHLAALYSVRGHLAPEHQKTLEKFASIEAAYSPRSQVWPVIQGYVRRQRPWESVAMGAAMAVGLL